MAEKVAKLGIERDHKNYLYYVGGEGHVHRKHKNGTTDAEIVHANAVQRDNSFLYFLDKDGDVARSPRAVRKSKPQ